MLILTVPLISLRLQTYIISFKRFIFFFIHISIIVRSIANISSPNQLKSRVHITRFLLNIGSIWLFSMVIILNVCTYSHNLCLSLSKSQGAWVWSVQLDISFFLRGYYIASNSSMHFLERRKKFLQRQLESLFLLCTYFSVILSVRFGCVVKKILY